MISRRSPSPPKPSVVTRGLIEHFDFADGKGTEATLKSRVSDNVLTLSGFNFDENSGWTGKGLKFDGVTEKIPFAKTGTTYEFVLNISSLGDVHKKFIGDQLAIDTNAKKYYLGFMSNVTYETDKVVQISAIVGTNEFYLNGVLYRQSMTIPRIAFEELLTKNTRRFKGIAHSFKIYNVALTPEEIQQNYEYEQSIDRTTISTYPMLQEQKSYGIGLTSQLSEEQKATFRLSIDGTKFVAGLRYCEGLEVEEFTYSEIQVEMEKEEWSKIEELE